MGQPAGVLAIINLAGCDSESSAAAAAAAAAAGWLEFLRGTPMADT